MVIIEMGRFQAKDRAFKLDTIGIISVNMTVASTDALLSDG
jgi:hypothetical protein